MSTLLAQKLSFFCRKHLKVSATKVISSGGESAGTVINITSLVKNKAQDGKKTCVGVFIRIIRIVHTVN